MHSTQSKGLTLDEACRSRWGWAKKTLFQKADKINCEPVGMRDVEKRSQTTGHERSVINCNSLPVCGSAACLRLAAVGQVDARGTPYWVRLPQSFLSGIYNLHVLYANKYVTPESTATSAGRVTGSSSCEVRSCRLSLPREQRSRHCPTCLLEEAPHLMPSAGVRSQVARLCLQP